VDPVDPDPDSDPDPQHCIKVCIKSSVPDPAGSVIIGLFAFVSQKKHQLLYISYKVPVLYLADLCIVQYLLRSTETYSLGGLTCKLFLQFHHQTEMIDIIFINF
jgi:hypothetical protein